MLSAADGNTDDSEASKEHGVGFGFGDSDDRQQEGMLNAAMLVVCIANDPPVVVDPCGLPENPTGADRARIQEAVQIDNPINGGRTASLLG